MRSLIGRCMSWLIPLVVSNTPKIKPTCDYCYRRSIARVGCPDGHLHKVCGPCIKLALQAWGDSTLIMPELVKDF